MPQKDEEPILCGGHKRGIGEDVLREEKAEGREARA
eukprot:CAMPEP_0195038808 /NCGR_PEP_ID=MMETSP0326_2-20130528/78324_1 /TAXON_ID=2866 ORGANISM="Crypthecodinium cohnii, Strain Seligo" /NCGR_SAMPLE_ID=MMETSP0326_2 /ASSEMBLY_ACC=CAM_ASM_000348 /LENGTH=35 /DNA_ID= /DNA_START= /DNA_END= /DNA_ORIENTATION=